jgi:hypothetical protein
MHKTANLDFRSPWDRKRMQGNQRRLHRGLARRKHPWRRKVRLLLRSSLFSVVLQYKLTTTGTSQRHPHPRTTNQTPSHWTPNHQTTKLPASLFQNNILCIPTIFSGGEYSISAGVTNSVTNEKIQYSPPLASQYLVILHTIAILVTIRDTECTPLPEKFCFSGPNSRSR